MFEVKQTEWLRVECLMLHPYLHENRRADPTRGFLMRCAELHPGFDRERYGTLSPGARDTYLKKLLSIPRAVLVGKDDETWKDR